MKLPKGAELWLPGYVRDRVRHALRQAPVKQLYVALTDHFEPMGGAVPLEQGLARMAAWEERWPGIAADAPRDAEGRPPCFTFFYPQEEYHPAILDRIAGLCQTGTTDVEVHIHHDGDTGAGFREKMTAFCERLHRDHGLLRMQDGRLVFGFIHGNWALDNSRPDGRWCGVTGELQILAELGCYADFTMPSLPSPTQSRIVNQIYWTGGDAGQPRGFDKGVEATVGGGRQGDLLMITGPMGLRYRDRRQPRLETGEVAVYDPPTPYRVERWLDLAPRLGDAIFLKLFGHSAREDNAAALLGNGREPGTLRSLFQWVHQEATARGLEVHWVSAYDMYRAVAARIGEGAPGTPRP